ncbi:hypothetical protein PCC7418_0516 [Halothece sp. PCC 7418]|uniref:hypothetical protein n=1 Tax=Halothece sp. (strain PCC 7418) TaxID=65093 RepID=UPI0002A08297|nr:hypothetical protein [Halothece sp. PCC 7418]AFZ42745.1 hypothetical protein PCC7418_0516 [Halothece sp. PCC 7418]
MEYAKTLSEEFFERYGTHSVVEHNVYQHIEPRIANLDWENLSWKALAQRTEALFLEKKDITSLHNWAIATYYQAQVHPEKMEDWITAWCCAIANLRNDPALKDIPWLGSETIDFEQLSQDLKNFLMSFREGKTKLNELRNIDRNNVTLLELSKQITQIEEQQEISRLLDDGNLKLAVRKARSSQDEKIRYMVAEICIKILIEGVEKRNLYQEDIMQLGRWAYSLCPNEPDFYTLYRELGLR